MKINRYQLREIEVDFLDHITAMWPNESEDKALFRAVQEAFVFSGKMRLCFPVSPVLVSSLATCSVIALGYDKRDIPWDQADHYRALLDVLRGLIYTAGVAYRNNDVDIIGGKIHLGSLRLPDWFPEWAGRRY